eukprot:4478559-Karenia_brevis.AAC.1
MPGFAVRISKIQAGVVGSAQRLLQGADVRFSEHLDALVAGAGLDQLSDWERLQVRKSCIREAAMRTRDDMLKEENN